MDGSPIVFKVKYGDVLRRFKVNTFERKLDLDFDGLKKKIVSLFNFASNAKLMLTYTDEDGDVVTLGDDNDLIDAVHQHLNPLRITVKLSSEDKSKEDDLSNDSSAVDLKSLVSEILNNVPEPVQGIISPVIADLATKVATSISSGNISELLACLSNLGLPNLSQNSENLSTDARDGHSQSSNGSPDGALDVLLNVISELPSNVKAKSQDVTAGTVAGPSGTAIVNTAVQPGKDKPSDTSNASASAHNSRENADQSKILPDGSSTGTFSRSIPSACPFSGISQNVEWVPFSTSVSHRGIQCDGCGILPITGPRYKSILKLDYDLCAICFEKERKPLHFVRLDYPSGHRDMPFRAPHDGQTRHRAGKCHPHRFGKDKQSSARLDSRFIQDVNIVDGTVVAPSAPLTKIWRVRNNGTLAWPPKTQLVWIGGDMLFSAVPVELEMPSTGLPVDQELDIALDFISPMDPGRYVSYFRLASPSGLKFGQRVWVLIQVDGSLVDDTPLHGNIRNLNLNLPPLAPLGNTFEPLVEADDDNPQKVAGGLDVAVAGLVPVMDQELKFPINDQLIVGGPSSPKPPSTTQHVGDVASSSSSVPLAPSAAATPVEKHDFHTLPAADEVDDAMGFEYIDLNREVKEYDLEQRKSDLVDVSDWDPFLVELQEMGFHDNELNKKLLEENNGSIQRVVLSLVAEENAAAL